ncbi:hypothetical protein RRF57_009287 [Xylaria bambusicola]|uniref:Uncharacterized protein n=1 Tax=Xylaria bambusicola TaxID=326684 RepID=A0AAN7UUQ5_9PEZI
MEAVLNRVFHPAIGSGSTRVVRLFLDHRRNVTTLDDAGTPALHMAAQLKFEEVLIELVKSGNDIDLGDSTGDTALDVARRHNYEGVVRFFMRRKGALLISSKLSEKCIDVKLTREDYD